MHFLEIEYTWREVAPYIVLHASASHVPPWNETIFQLRRAFTRVRRRLPK
jgi:hypothetical protein